MSAAIEQARVELVGLCHRLGDPDHDFAILGEGNAAVSQGGAQLVTASGSRLGAITPDEIVELDRGTILRALNAGAVDDAAWTSAVRAAAVGSPAHTPTIEAALHAIASELTGCAWTAHTHPISVTGLMSSAAARRFAAEPLFPDQIVVMGPAACFIPYTDPGFPLAVAFRDALVAYHGGRGRWPRVVLLANHGMVAIADSAVEAFEITAMTDKAAKIFATAAQFGEPQPLTPQAVARIDTRPDEEHRRAVLREAAR